MNRIPRPSQWNDWEFDERCEWERKNITKPWVVVQDCSPFLIRIESEHDTRRGAEWAVGSRRYLQVMRADDAHATNLRFSKISGEDAAAWCANYLRASRER